MPADRELSCVPQVMWSWDFDIEGASGGPASIKINRCSEAGRICLGDAEFEVRKHGVFSGCWTLERDGRIFAEATKTSVLTRSFELQIDRKVFTLKAQSAFTRGFELLLDERPVLEICPAHAFTRRASIKGTAEVPELMRLFAFWIVAMMWRRSAQSD